MAEREQLDDCERIASDAPISAAPGAMSGEPAVVSLRTDQLDLNEGRAAWQSTLGRLYCETDIAWPHTSDRFDGEWGGRPLGDLHISTIRAEQQTVVRSAAMARSDASADYLLCLITAGHVEVEQAGRETVLRTGAFALLDLSRPFVFRSPTCFRQVVAHIPREMLTCRLPEPYLDHATGRSFGPGPGASAIAGRVLVDLAAEGAGLSSGATTSFAMSAVDMVAAGIAEVAVRAGIGTGHRAADLDRIRQVVDELLHDPDLTVTGIAARCGMSLRNVQKLLAGAGTTPRALLHRMRIDRAKRYLVSTDLSVADIAQSVGFRDVSHFSRTFRTLVGTSPGRFRTAPTSTDGF
ncbi:AraC family transcriptional regulator [Millisia brevis]|uniref:AraC family transcriptional regulator n=1 Tax=Millisia brevis TaxID=264148 RepID=UPI000837A1D9